MIKTILFDMGGTLEDIWYNDQTIRTVTGELRMWEVTYYHRELRPKVKETLEELKKRGYHLGVISNTASLYSVFDVLEQYGIRDYFEDVTLSSVTGYRKPHPSIFQISLRQMQAKPEECAYVGDTISRDIIGAKRMHFGAAIQIQSFLSAQKDAGVDAAYQPDHIIRELPELVDYLEEGNENGENYSGGYRAAAAGCSDRRVCRRRAARTNLASGGNPHTYSGSTRLVRGHGDKLHHV